VRTYRKHDLVALPNILSAARIPLALAFPFVREKESALAIIGAAGVTDLLDGFAARKLGQASPVGAAIDGFADKAFSVTLLGTLVARRVLSPASALLLATREILELPLAIRVLWSEKARAVNIDRGANGWGKLATTLEMGAVVASLARARIAKPMVIAAGIAGAVAGFSYWLRELRAEKKWTATFAAEVDRPVPYLLAGGKPELLTEIAA
jgi:phosphatidylglycerophosphate synthase